MTPVLELLGSGPASQVCFVGCPGRTWFIDSDILAAVMEIMSETADYCVVHVDPRGFDLRVRDFAEALGLRHVECPVTLDSRGRSVRDPGMLSGCCCVVAFPEEPKAEVEESRARKFVMDLPDWKTADPSICEAAERLGIPVLVVRRSGKTEWRQHDQ